MSDFISKTLFPEIDSFNIIGKDLFTKKLGHNIRFDLNSTQKNYANFTKPNFFKNIRKFPKTKINNLFSTEKEENLRKIWEPKKNANIYQKEKNVEIDENNKQFVNLNLESPFKTIKSKKEIKLWLNNKEKNAKPKKIFLDSNSGFKNYNNSLNNSIKFEKSNDKLQLPKFKSNKKFSYQNLIVKNKSDNDFTNIIKRISKEDKKSKIFIKSFFENLIDINTSYDTYNKFISLINHFNELYFYLFEIESFPIKPSNIKFLDIHKFSAILNSSLIFLSKDKNLYNENVSKMKELMQKYIYVSIKSFNYKSLESIKITNFLIKFGSIKEDFSLTDILNSILDLLFGQKMNEYKKIRKCLKQLLNNIDSQTPNQVLSLVNDTILFCHNFVKLENQNDKKNNNSKKNKRLINDIPNVNTPYIKNKLRKKYCLVLDLDETLIHNLNLPFGEYYLVRPGIFDLFEKVHNIYEIIIYTAAKKEYAYNIIDKIDYKNYIDYILYKKHLVNIEGDWVKKLDLIGRDLKKIIYVDNLEKNAKYNQKNIYQISSWYNNLFDKEITILKEKLINIATCGKYDDDITKGLLEK